MTHKFKVGDRVTWNSEAGHVSGTIIKVHTKKR
jgi:Hypervirulence associated proteins TUDOR domain